MQFNPQTIEETSRSNDIQPPALYGDDQKIAALVRRMRYLIPGATNAPDPIIWRAAQIAAIHGLDPFSGDLWIYSVYENPKDDQWIVDVGIAAWRRAAQRQAKYVATFAALDPDTTRQHIGADWTPDDVGARCTLHRLDVAREALALSIPYEPTIAYGFWRKQAHKKRNGEWMADQLANTQTKLDKAQKRAEKKALKTAFSLDYPDEHLIGATEDATWRVADLVERQTTTEELIRSPVADPVDRTNADWHIFA